MLKACCLSVSFKFFLSQSKSFSSSLPPPTLNFSYLENGQLDLVYIRVLADNFCVKQFLIKLKKEVHVFKHLASGLVVLCDKSLGGQRASLEVLGKKVRQVSLYIVAFYLDHVASISIPKLTPLPEVVFDSL